MPKPEPRLLNEREFQRHLMTSGLIPPNSRGVVGYSGGADSTALVHLLSQLGVDFIAAHLHHGMRPEADEEMAKCEAFSESLDVPFLPGHADVPKIAADHKMGLEEAGREARYSFLRQAAHRTEASWIATAHTRTDHIETILLHAIRGSGLAGLAGIKAKRDDLLRPLLPFDRAHTIAYCTENGLWFHDDPANTDLRFSRSRLRARVLPELAQINPHFESAFERLSELAEEEDKFMDGIAAAALEQAERPPNGELRFLTEDVELVFDREVLRHVPSVIRRRALRLAFEYLGENLDFDQSQKLCDEVQESDRGSLTATGGQCVAEWSEQTLHLRRLDVTSPARYPLQYGETDAEAFGWTISVDRVPFESQPQQRQGLKAIVDHATLKAPLHLRAIEPGDKMRPLGFDGSRKIADIVSEAHLTEAARKRLPLIADMAGPLWLPGVCLDARAAVSSETQSVLLLEFKPLSG